MPRYRRFSSLSLALFAVQACTKSDLPSPQTTPAKVQIASSGTTESSAPAQELRPDLAPDVGATPRDSLVLAIDSATDPISVLVAPIDTTLTLSRWLAVHTDDKVGAVPPADQLEDKFCRSSHLKMRLNKRTFVRSALFDIVDVPVGEPVPPDTARVAQDFCDLRTMWLSTEVADSAAATALTDTLAQLIDQRLGKHTLDLEIGAAGAGGWQDTRTWQGRGTTVVVATLPIFAADRASHSGEEDAAPPPDTVKARRVIAAAYAPNSGYEDIPRLMRRFGRMRERRGVPFANADSAMALSDLPAINKDLRAVLAHVRARFDSADTLRDAKSDAALFRAVKATHEIAATLNPPRRAAALLAADIVTNAAARVLPGGKPIPLQDSLQSVGFTFNDLPIDQLVQNNRPWLWEAYNLDSLGRAGHLAFVELLSQGWTTKGACEDGENMYERIIAHGEAALARGDQDPMVHYYVGSAYKTIFDASSPAPSGEYVAARAFGPRAESARLKAIEHYRAALASMKDQAMRRETWNRMIGLMLSRNGEQPEYICFYD